MRQDGQRSRGSSSDGVEGALRGRQVSSPLDSCLWPSLSAPALGRGGSGEGGGAQLRAQGSADLERTCTHRKREAFPQPPALPFHLPALLRAPQAPLST